MSQGQGSGVQIIGQANNRMENRKRESKKKEAEEEKDDKNDT